ncbi:MAG: transposase family protein [Chloroflexi bacterium]|jgi:transposase InsO family protein|nr:transposase family protein [Chloroflexota bacterium]
MKKRFTEEQIIRILKADEGGRSAKELLSDNGPEFTSNPMKLWTYEKQIVQTFIEPGIPIQNTTIKSFNGNLEMNV